MQAPAIAEPPRKLPALPDIASAGGPLDLRPQIAPTRLLSALPAPVEALRKPSPLAQEDQFYREVVAASDARLVHEYRDRWTYHELQGDEDRSRWGDRHVDIASLDFYNGAPSERDARRAFAQRALRLRVEATLGSYARHSEALGRARAIIQTGPQGRVRMSGDESGSSELRFGYNPFTDQTRVEYTASEYRIGVYHPLMRTFGGEPFARVTGIPGKRPITPSATYRFETTLMELSVTKALSKSVDTTLTASRPLRQREDVQPSYGLQLRYRF